MQKVGKVLKNFPSFLLCTYLLFYALIFDLDLNFLKNFDEELFLCTGIIMANSYSMAKLDRNKRKGLTLCCKYPSVNKKVSNDLMVMTCNICY